MFIKHLFPLHSEPFQLDAVEQSVDAAQLASGEYFARLIATPANQPERSWQVSGNKLYFNNETFYGVLLLLVPWGFISIRNTELCVSVLRFTLTTNQCMFNVFRQWRERRIQAKSRFTLTDWQRVAAKIPVLDRLNGDQQRRLFKISTLFLHAKSLTGAQGFVITDTVSQSIALQACLPILNLGLDWYDGWVSIIVYPAAFNRQSTTVDEFGITHIGKRSLSGEAWLRGPVVLSWTDTQYAGIRDGHNVVIHEFVHKLDMLNGRANGFPPMQNNMSPALWSRLMGDAFDNFQKQPKKGLDRYGATNPAEFFAVLSEVFFETPDLLVSAYPELYELFSQFFLQFPLESVRE